MSARRTSARGQHRLHNNNNRAQVRTVARVAVDTNSAVSAANRGMLILPQQRRRTRLGAQGYSRFIGRVGALAVALGVGVGFTTGMPGLAWADDTESSSPADSSSPNPSSEQSDNSTTTDTTTSTGSASPSDTSTSADESSADDPTTGIVQSSGGAVTGSYGPNATAPSAVADSEPAGSDAPDDTESTTAAAPADTPTTNILTTNIPTPSAEPPAPTTPAPQDDSTTIVNTSTAPPPPITAAETGSESNGNDGLDATTSFNTTTLQDEPTANRLMTASSTDDTFTASQLFAASGTQDNSAFATALDAPAAPQQDPVQALLAIPGTVLSAAVSFVAAVLAPFLAPSPLAPAQPPLALFAVLDWVRREIARTFFNRSPNAAANVFTTSEDDDVSGNVLGNDTDDDGDPLTATVVTGPAHGDLTLNPDGSFTYTPDANYNGTDTFTY
ncbi:MAG: hypothetical protein QOH20_3084, partial [Mycobacterium sp.]|nr:hypothetical protein [Mycobacterium sp.]